MCNADMRVATLATFADVGVDCDCDVSSSACQPTSASAAVPFYSTSSSACVGYASVSEPVDCFGSDSGAQRLCRCTPPAENVADICWRTPPATAHVGSNSMRCDRVMDTWNLQWNCIQGCAPACISSGRTAVEFANAKFGRQRLVIRGYGTSNPACAADSSYKLQAASDGLALTGSLNFTRVDTRQPCLVAFRTIGGARYAVAISASTLEAKMAARRAAGVLLPVSPAAAASCAADQRRVLHEAVCALSAAALGFSAVPEHTMDGSHAAGCYVSASTGTVYWNTGAALKNLGNSGCNSHYHCAACEGDCDGVS